MYIDLSESSTKEYADLRFYNIYNFEFPVCVDLFFSAYGVDPNTRLELYLGDIMQSSILVEEFGGNYSWTMFEIPPGQANGSMLSLRIPNLNDEIYHGVIAIDFVSVTLNTSCHDVGGGKNCDICLF